MITLRFYKCRPRFLTFPIFAWLIMAFQNKMPWNKKAWSHMALGYESETGTMKVADVTSKTCRDRIKSHFIDDYTIIETKTRSYDISRKEFLSWYEKHEGKNYDNAQIFGLASKILNIVSFNKRGSGFKRMICSELILSFLVEFDNLSVKDSDNWDLNMTWDRI